MLSKELSITRERYRGYLDALKKEGIEADSNLSICCSHQDEENIQLIKALLQSSDRPDGILASVEKLPYLPIMQSKKTIFRFRMI
ncbi:type 1 periplasmic-binding domain-containing protein [Algoriphagus hitonicola]|uniref:hypothetical protein n=1 Tax=Algoriphagus hitonicola TaxID=435880 RepID=UPI003614C4EB